MNILIAGRLGRYAERINALEALGHTLVYCTMPAPVQRPLPDDLKNPAIPQVVVTPRNAAELVRRLLSEYEIDVIYSLKNVWDGSLELLAIILDANVGVPVIRHYKEHYCRPSELERRSLMETDAQIYINNESLEWFRDTYQVRLNTAHVLDTDYLPAKYMTDEFRLKLFDNDGIPHLLMAGGLADNEGRSDVRDLCREMRRRGIVTHLYGRKFVGHDAAGVWGVGHECSRREYERLEQSGDAQLHDHVDPRQFVREWSVYDAGLMHPARPGSDGAAFFNYPNRLVPYLAAGLPLAQQSGEHRAMERLIRDEGVGFLYRDGAELAEVLHDRILLARLSAQVRARRHAYSAEAKAPALAAILARYAGSRP
jgi:hypothetical protein